MLEGGREGGREGDKSKGRREGKDIYGVRSNIRCGVRDNGQRKHYVHIIGQLLY